MSFKQLDYERADLRARIAALILEVKLIRCAFALRRNLVLRKDDNDEDEGPDDDDGPNSPHLRHLAGGGDPPQLPDNRPPTSAMRTQAAKLVARELAEAIKDGRGEAFLKEVLSQASWLRERSGQILSYLDQPKSLQELQQLANEPAAGYQEHHIVEQRSATEAGYTRAEIDSPSNLVRVPTLKHQEINGWYARANVDYGGLSPREYLSDKPWYVRQAVGLDALRNFGVLE
jgi:hypothetical protein